MMRPRAILFDLDGTLVDSLGDIAMALTRALADHGHPAPTRAQVRSWIGAGEAKLVERALDAGHGPASSGSLTRGGRPHDDVLASYRAHYTASPVVYTRVYDGLPEILDRIDVPLAVVTNKRQDLAVRICDALLARWRFAVIVGGRPGRPLKPNPESALAVAAELGVPANECAFVGDAGTDVETARAAGMLAVAVTWGYGAREAFAGASVIVDAPAELAQLIAS